MTTNLDNCCSVAGASPSARLARPVTRLRRRSDGLSGLWPNLEALFEPLLSAEASAERAFQPAIELRETKDAYLVHVELPGVKRADIELKLEQDLFVLRGRKESHAQTEEGTLHRSETVYGAFERRFRLPHEIQVEAAEANFRDGVLSVKLPKQAPEERARVIPVLGE
jgi:HSP20 family protein